MRNREWVTVLLILMRVKVSSFRCRVTGQGERRGREVLIEEEVVE